MMLYNPFEQHSAEFKLYKDAEHLSAYPTNDCSSISFTLSDDIEFDHICMISVGINNGYWFPTDSASLKSLYGDGSTQYWAYSVFGIMDPADGGWFLHANGVSIWPNGSQYIIQCEPEVYVSCEVSGRTFTLTQYVPYYYYAPWSGFVYYM